jgi:hypothetical protein
MHQCYGDESRVTEGLQRVRGSDICTSMIPKISENWHL